MRFPATRKPCDIALQDRTLLVFVFGITSPPHRPDAAVKAELIPTRPRAPACSSAASTPSSRSCGWSPLRSSTRAPAGIRMRSRDRLAGDALVAESRADEQRCGSRGLPMQRCRQSPDHGASEALDLGEAIARPAWPRRPDRGNQQPNAFQSSSAASVVSLAPIGSRIIRAMQPSAARGETAVCVSQPGGGCGRSDR